MSLMQPRDYDEKHLRLPCYVSPKFDGVRVHNNEGALRFRSNHEVPNVRDLYKVTQRFAHGVDGEGLIPGIPFAESAGRLRSAAYDRRTNLYLFDLWTHPGVFEERYAELRRIGCTHPRVHIITHNLVHTVDEMWVWHHRFLAAGLEGTVIKTPDHRYVGGKTWEWMRIVPLKSADIRVIGVNPGKGKHKGRLGSLVCVFWNKGVCYEVKVGTGFDDATRELWWNRPHLIIGKTIRVTYKELTHRGSLRQPRFDRVRVDK